MKAGRTAMIINTSEFMPGDFTRNADFSLPTERLRARSRTRRGKERTHFVNTTRLATALFGSSLGANIFMVGFAYQLGTLPLPASAIEQAIALNGEAVPMNLAAFHWGRRAALDLAGVEEIARPAPETHDENRELSQSFEEMVSRRVKFLTAYQSKRYAKRYRKWVEKAKDIEQERVPEKCGFADAVARYLFKLMAYKDEYEVARLYTDGTFLKQVANDLGGEKLRFEFHMAPPLLAKTDPVTGELRKMSFGPWMMSAFKVLAKLKFLRGTPLDVFGRTEERKTERKLIRDYEAMLEEVLPKLNAGNHALAVGLAAIPEKIRGFGHVKARHLAAAKADEAALFEQFRTGQAADAQGGGVIRAIWRKPSQRLGLYG